MSDSGPSWPSCQDLYGYMKCTEIFDNLYFVICVTKNYLHFVTIQVHKTKQKTGTAMQKIFILDYRIDGMVCNKYLNMKKSTASIL